MADIPSKPAEIPEWATNGGGTISTPALGRKQTGWQLGDWPSAPEQNWLHYWSEQWRVYMDTVIEHSETWAPVITGLDPGDYSVQRGWYKRYPGTPSVVDVYLQLTWNNVTLPGIAGNSVNIELPYSPADHSPVVVPPNPPSVSFGPCDLPGSVWPNQATDRAIQLLINQFGGSQVVQIQRISTTNSSLGFLTIGNAVATQVIGSIRYYTDGTYLL